MMEKHTIEEIVTSNPEFREYAIKLIYQFAWCRFLCENGLIDINFGPDLISHNVTQNQKLSFQNFLSILHNAGSIRYSIKDTFIEEPKQLLPFWAIINKIFQIEPKRPSEESQIILEIFNGVDKIGRSFIGHCLNWIF